MIKENVVSAETDASPAATPPAPPAAPVVADGVRRSLDPQYVPFQRVIGWIATACISFCLLAGAAILWLTDLPPWANHLLLPAWLALSAGQGWLAYVWPAVEMRHTFYMLDDDGIEIRSGVWWRAVTSVPRSRVQHIDVTQGPIERSYDLGRLVIFTAGTDHSRVELPGLNYRMAFLLRNHLLPRGTDDAV
jgi:uncharacterized protein